MTNNATNAAPRERGKMEITDAWKLAIEGKFFAAWGVATMRRGRMEEMPAAALAIHATIPPPPQLAANEALLVLVRDGTFPVGSRLWKPYGLQSALERLGVPPAISLRESLEDRCAEMGGFIDVVISESEKALRQAGEGLSEAAEDAALSRLFAAKAARTHAIQTLHALDELPENLLWTLEAGMRLAESAAILLHTPDLQGSDTNAKHHRVKAAQRGGRGADKHKAAVRSATQGMEVKAAIKHLQEIGMIKWIKKTDRYRVKGRSESMGRQLLKKWISEGRKKNSIPV